MVENILEYMGLKKVEDITDLVNTSFIINSKINVPNTFRIYPTTKKAGLNRSQLFNLYGTHWAYDSHLSNIQELKKIEGDTSLILNQLLSEGKIHPKFPVYAFHQAGIKKDGGLWVFEPKTLGWEYFITVLKPRFETDLKHYKSNKRNMVSSRKAF